MLTTLEARQVMSQLVVAATSDNAEAHAVGARRLLACVAADWLRLDDCARFNGSTSMIVEGARNWLRPSLNESSGFVAAVTSMHVDGRLRQRATQVLAFQPGRLQAAALAVRCLDHVWQVRDDALAGLLAHTATDEVDIAVGILVAASGRTAAGPALHIYAGELRRSLRWSSTLQALGSSGNAAVRAWVFEQRSATALLTVEGVISAVMTDTDQRLRQRYAQWIESHATSAQLAQLLTSRFADLRAAALHAVDDDDLSVEQLYASLLDRSGAVRAMAQWRAARRGVSAAEVYRADLASAQPRIKISVQALAAVGSVADAPLAHTYLAHPSPRVRELALATMVALVEESEVLAAATPMLWDPSARVSARAARVLARAGASPDMALPAWSAELPSTRRAAWVLMSRAGGWARLDADLRACLDPDERLSTIGRADLRSWLAGGATDLWTRPSPELVERVRDFLESCDLPELIREHLAFCVQLPHIPRPASPPAASADPSPPVSAWRRLRGRSERR